MEAQNVLGIFNTMVNENIVYIFHGEFNFTMVDTLLTDIKRELAQSNTDRSTQKKTYKVLVECLENAYRHSVENKPPAKGKQEGIFLLTRTNEGYGIIVGNTIKNEEIETLTQKLEEANSMDPDALKQKYRSMIKNSVISEKGGAGLGIMDIAIKSGSQLLYNFDKHTENTTFFTLEIQITA